MTSRSVFLAPAVAALTSLACTTVSVTPELCDGSGRLELPGHVEYDGSPDYLPDPLKAASPRPDQADLTFRYSYDVDEEESDWSLAVLIIPVSLLGFPTGSSREIATAELQIVDGMNVVKTYEVTATARRSRTIYTGDSRSELRRRALLAAAEAIEGQLACDRDELLQLIQRARTEGYRPQ